MNHGLYYLGLFLVVIYILMGFDDFIWDVIALFRTIFRTKKHPKLNMIDVLNHPVKLRAVTIAAWHEDNVIGDVIDHFISTSIYPKTMYHIFIGIYPNDEATIRVVRELEQRHPNVHCVINELNGPTTKAQNINYVIKVIKEFEKSNNWTFDSFTIHDSEDVVNPYELSVTNFLMDNHGALQFPVFPLMQYPTFKNFFKNITTNTYADEFAEHHYLTMVYRDNVSAFVPSAGTGFALRKDVIDSFEDGEVLPTDSLTEDYKLALKLYQRGIPMHFVLAKIPLVDQNLRIKNNYVATRSMFPNTFKTAVKQKRRWITGITMQTIKFKDVFTIKGISFAGRYSLYRDQKAKIGNLIAFVGYPFFIYYLVSIFVDLPAVYPTYTMSWWLSILVTVMMIERQIFRIISIYNVYGMRSVFFSSFLPPILPIRYVCGNIINFTATVQAYLQILFPRFGNNKVSNVETKKKTKYLKQIIQVRKDIKWDKTDHEFLPKEVLNRYYQRIGDILIKQGSITISSLKKALRQSQENRYRGFLGQYLMEKNYITEYQLLSGLKHINHGVYLTMDNLPGWANTVVETFDATLLSDYLVFPLLSDGNVVSMVMSYLSPINTPAIFKTLYPHLEMQWHYANEEAIIRALHRSYFDTHYDQLIFKDVSNMYSIDQYQFLIAIQKTYEEKGDLASVLQTMGIHKKDL